MKRRQPRVRSLAYQASQLGVLAALCFSGPLAGEALSQWLGLGRPTHEFQTLQRASTARR